MAKPDWVCPSAPSQTHPLRALRCAIGVRARGRACFGWGAGGRQGSLRGALIHLQKVGMKHGQSCDWCRQTHGLVGVGTVCTVTLYLWADKIVKCFTLFIYCFTFGLGPAGHVVTLSGLGVLGDGPVQQELAGAELCGSGCSFSLELVFLASPWMPQARCLCPVCLNPAAFPGS